MSTELCSIACVMAFAQISRAHGLPFANAARTKITSLKFSRELFNNMRIVNIERSTLGLVKNLLGVGFPCLVFDEKGQFFSVRSCI